MKVLVKNLLHLCPAHLSARDAAACVAILTAALPAIARQRVICHGDLLPTNLLYHHDDESVTFTDLEGFMGANHPLFDVLAFLSISGLDLMAWDWQRRFLVRYLSRAGALGLDANSREYQDAYRGILVFFLVYRLNEQRINESGGAYFDNVGPRRFVTRKAARLAAGRRDAWRDDSMDEALNVRKRNLRRALSRRLYREHVDAMASAAAAID